MKPQFTAKITDIQMIDRRMPTGRYDRRDWTEYHAEARIYVTVNDPKNLLPSVDDYSDVLNNKAIRTTAVAEAIKLFGLAEDAKVRYSRTAGCPCGCSPAYIVCDWSSPTRSDIFVTVEVTNENPRNLVRIFSGERIDFRGQGWYRLETEGREKKWRKVETLNHLDKRPMVYVEMSDTTLA